MSTAMKRGVVCAAGLILGAPAWAQAGDPQAGDPHAAIDAAQSLYDQATAEMDAGKYARACPKLERATRLVPSAVGAKLTLAACYEGQGRLASAWSQYVLAAAFARRAGQAERAKGAAEKVAALRPRLAMLAVTVSQAAREIEGISVTRDGIPLSKDLWGVPVPVDAGRHKVVMTAPGYQPWQAELEIKADGEHAALEVQAPAPRASHGRRSAGIAMTSVGLVGLGAGAVFGGVVVFVEDDALNSITAKNLETASITALMLGGVLTTVGLVLWATAPAATADRVGSAAPRWSARLELLPGGAQVSGRW